MKNRMLPLWGVMACSLVVFVFGIKVMEYAVSFTALCVLFCFTLLWWLKRREQSSPSLERIHQTLDALSIEQVREMALQYINNEKWYLAFEPEPVDSDTMLLLAPLLQEFFTKFERVETKDKQIIFSCPNSGSIVNLNDKNFIVIGKTLFGDILIEAHQETLYTLDYSLAGYIDYDQSEEDVQEVCDSIIQEIHSTIAYSNIYCAIVDIVQSQG